jgi:hypothetical protein
MKKFFLTFLLSPILLFAQDIPEPYKSINDLPFDPYGFFVNHGQISDLLNEKQPKVIIEIGSWMGSSTRYIASNMPEDGILYAIDTWAGTPEEVAAHMQDPRLPYLYQLFLSNVKHEGLTHKIIPIRMRSTEAAKALNVKADVIYLDAAHDTKSVVEDIFAWYPHLNEDGVFCGDDFSFLSVRDALDYCSQILNKRIWAHGNFWRFY